MAKQQAVELGDQIKAWKWVMYREYEITGKVIQITDDLGDQIAKIEDETGHTDWYRNANGLTEKFEIISRANPATDRQMAYLRDLGYDGPANLTKEEASTKIDRLKAWKGSVGACHYCGSPAFGWGFFDEPACGQCGGK